MASDQLVPARLILRAELECQRRGSTQVMEELEQIEPDLASYLMEHLSLIHHKLLDLGAGPQPIRRLQRRITRLVLVAITAQRQAHYQLWKTEQGEGTTPPSA